MPKVSTVTLSSVLDAREVPLPNFDRQYLDDVSFVTAMTLVLMGNYCQTGHFGGPLAYTPYTVASHLIGPELGGLKYDYRRPKHPFSDKFMLAGGHNAPVTYALWMVLGEALYRKHQATGDKKYLAGFCTPGLFFLEFTMLHLVYRLLTFISGFECKFLSF